MSLNYDLTRCNSTKSEKDGLRVIGHDGKPIDWAVTNGLIWACIALQMNGIEDGKAAREFAVRLGVYQRMFGPYLMNHEEGKKPTPRPITTAEVFAHIGLRTNVTTKSRVSFLKSMGAQLAHEVERDLVAAEVERAEVA